MHDSTGNEESWADIPQPRSNSARPGGMDDPAEPEILRLRRRIAFLEQVEKAHSETREMLDSTTEMNRKLEETLKKARKEIQALRDELIRLTSPPTATRWFFRSIPPAIRNFQAMVGRSSLRPTSSWPAARCGSTSIG